MRLSEKQAQFLLEVVRDTLTIVNVSYPQEIRQKMLEQIINQQSDELIELDKEKP